MMTSLRWSPFMPLALVTLLALGCTPLSDQRPDQVDRREAVLTTDVKGALIGSAQVSAASIRVDLEGGTLVLHGFVDSEGERFEALRIARRVAAGTPVEDRLEIR